MRDNGDLTDFQPLRRRYEQRGIELGQRSARRWRHVVAVNRPGCVELLRERLELRLLRLTPGILLERGLVHETIPAAGDDRAKPGAFAAAFERGKKRPHWPAPGVAGTPTSGSLTVVTRTGLNPFQSFFLTTRLERLKSGRQLILHDSNIASVFYGPVLLAAEESEPRSDWRPVVLDATDIGKSITADPKTLRFGIGGVAFRPFYEMYGRYSVYLDVKMKPLNPVPGQPD